MKTHRKILWLSTPINATWYITSKCNLRCTHCYLTDYTKNTEKKIIVGVLDQLKAMAVRSISYIGGEPLIRTDLEEIIRMTVERGIEVETCTNGVLADEDRAASLIKAGCEKFQVSLEGHSPELSDPVRGKDTFQKILNGAGNLKRGGAKVKLNVTISKQNYKSIPELIKLAESICVDSLRLSAFVPFGTGVQAVEEFQLTKEDIEDIRRIVSLEMKRSRQLIESPIFITSPHQNRCGNTFGCGAGTHNLIINTDLSLSACDIANEKDRTLPIKNFEDIRGYWLHHPLFKKWRGETDDPDFEGVHQNHCHLAYMTYKKDLFEHE